MLISPEQLTAQLLATAGYGFFPPLVPNAPASRWTLFINSFPDEPTKIIACSSNGLNRPDGRLMSGTPIYHPGVQVRVRSGDMDDAFSKIKTIFDYVTTVRRLLVTSLTVQYRIDNLSANPPIYLGVGLDDQRPSYVFDLYVSYTKIGV